MPSSADLKVLVWDTPLRSSGDVAELVGRCVEGGARAVLLDAKGVSAELLDLRSGVAGELLQKLQNYRLRLAGVIAAEQRLAGRFRELVLEANRGAEFRFFETRTEAEAWLGGGRTTGA